MTDPAVEAADRAWEEAEEVTLALDPHSGMLAAAREALKPIRELHTPKALYRNAYNAEGTFIGRVETGKVCAGCHSVPDEFVEQHCYGCEAERDTENGCEGVHFQQTVRPSAAWPCDTARLVYTTEELNR